MKVRQESVLAAANRMIPFTTAASWAGLDGYSRDRGVKADCPSCGGSGRMRIYPDHGWCFSERKWFTAVALLARAWRMSKEDAAMTALLRAGYVPPGHAERFRAQRENLPEPALDQLATGLRTWCEANCADWGTRQYQPDVAGLLSRCLGLLPLVRTEEDCGKWLARCKEAMGRVFPPLAELS